MDIFSSIMDIFPDDWFDGIRLNYGDTLSDEMIVQSVHQASTFFHINDPAAIYDDVSTGVYTNLSSTPMDDILVVGREQLSSMGITEKDGLDLVMTHEGAHRTLQGMNMNYSSHQEELCCDFMAGVRAGLNGMDVSQLEDSLADTAESQTHPNGALRVTSIEEGVKFAQQYMEANNQAPTFSECIDHFNNEIIDFKIDCGINLRQEESMAAFHGYSTEEIKNHLSKASHEMDVQESYMRHHKRMAESKERCNQPHSSEDYAYQQAYNKYEAARKEYNKWGAMKPDN